MFRKYSNTWIHLRWFLKHILTCVQVDNIARGKEHENTDIRNHMALIVTLMGRDSLVIRFPIGEGKRVGKLLWDATSSLGSYRSECKSEMLVLLDMEEMWKTMPYHSAEELRLHQAKALFWKTVLLQYKAGIARDRWAGWMWAWIWRIGYGWSGQEFWIAGWSARHEDQSSICLWTRCQLKRLCGGYGEMNETQSWKPFGLFVQNWWNRWTQIAFLGLSFFILFPRSTKISVYENHSTTSSVLVKATESLALIAWYMSRTQPLQTLPKTRTVQLQILQKCTLCDGSLTNSTFNGIDAHIRRS